MESFWAVVTLFGDYVLWSVALLILFLFYMGVQKDYIRFGKAKEYNHILKKFLLIMIPVILVSIAGSELLKLAFHIPRPCIPCPAIGCNPYCPITFAFPSGHTTTVTGIVTAVFLILRRKRYVVIYVLPVLIAVSRVELGVHTVSDVVAGSFLGLVLTLIVWRYRKKLYKWEDEIL